MSSSSSSSPPPPPPPAAAPAGEAAALQNGGFQTLLNFRDVAATVNAHQARRVLREGLLYRSARPDEATPADRARLRSHYGLRTVIDLRSKTEHAKAAEKRAATATTAAKTTTSSSNGNGKTNNKNSKNNKVPDPNSPATTTTPNEDLARPLHLIPGVAYREVRVTGPGFERHMLSQLSWWAFLRLVVLYAVGQRMAAVAVLGREVMAPRGLLGLGCDTLDASGAEIAAGLEIFLGDEDENEHGHEAGTTTSGGESHGGEGEGENGGGGAKNGGAKRKPNPPLPLLIHCTQGKDRTGLMVALVLLICRVAPDAVEHDYELTDAALAAGEPAAARAARLAEIREMGLPEEEFGTTCPGFVPGLVAHLRGRYGGLDAYLDGVGFGPGKRVRLRERLLC